MKLTRFIKSSLIRRITSVSVLNIIVACTVIIVMGAMTLSATMGSAIKREMSLNASLTALKVDQMFSSVLESTTNLKFAADAAFAHTDVLIKAIGVYSSVMEKERISLPLHDFEVFASKTIVNALAYNNGDVAGMGVFFEPEAFWPKVEDYSFYFTPGMKEEDLSLYRPYEEYGTYPYYSGTKTSMSTYITAPYYQDNQLLVTLSQPIFTQRGDFAGIAAADVSVNQMIDFITVDPQYPTMAATLLDHNLNIAYTTRPNKAIGDPLSTIIPDTGDLATIQGEISKKQAFEVEISDSSEDKVVRFFQPIHVGDLTWWSVTTISNSDLNATAVSSVVQLILMSMVLQILSSFYQLGYLRKTLAPIKKVVEAAGEIAKGHFHFDLRVKTGDELELLGDSFYEMTQHLKSMVQDIRYVLHEVGVKNLDVDTSADYVGEFEEIETSMHTIVATMNQIISEITLSSQQVSQGASNVTGGSQILSQGAVKQAETIESLSDQVTIISDRISENALHATEASQIFEELMESANSGTQEMKDMKEAMADIATSSSEIEKIMKTINDIAFQTNMLALNASVEAARAGQAGKGFSVVAQEVKSLASKSAVAAHHTSDLIQNSIQVVNRGSQLVESTSASLETIVTKINSTTALISDITTASNEQANSIHGVTEGIQQITGVVQSNSTAAMQSAAASEELLSQSDSLQTMVSAFQLKPPELPSDKISYQPSDS